MKTTKNRLMDVKARGAKWFSLALCLTAGFSLSACSDDDDGNGGGSGVTAQQMPKVADAGIQFPVTQYSDYATIYFIVPAVLYNTGLSSHKNASVGCVLIRVLISIQFITRNNISSCINKDLFHWFNFTYL